MTKEEVREQRFSHSLEIQIRFTDMDMNGHVNNGVYHSYFDMGRMHYFTEVFHAKTGNTLIAQVNTSYVKSVLATDTICIKSKIVRWGNSSFDMLQAIFVQNADCQELACYNVTTFVHLNNGKPSPVPDSWKQAVSNFEKDV